MNELVEMSLQMY